MKMRRLLLVVILVVLMVPQIAFSARNAEAQKFMGQGKYSQAMAVLQADIKAGKDNAKTHFLLASCLLALGKPEEAEESFMAAVGLDPGIEDKIAEVYLTQGIRRLKQNDPLAEPIFRKAQSHNSNIGKQICDTCFEEGNRLYGTMSFRAYEIAREYCGNYNSKIGARLLEFAKAEQVKERRNLYINEAAKFISKEAINRVFPPPSWKPVFEKTYVGKGMGQKDYLRTAQFDTDLKIGDKIIVFGDECEVWNGPGWQKVSNGKMEILNNTGTGGGFLGVKAPEGYQFKVRIERFLE